MSEGLCLQVLSGSSFRKAPLSPALGVFQDDLEEVVKAKGTVVWRMMPCLIPHGYVSSSTVMGNNSPSSSSWFCSCWCWCPIPGTCFGNKQHPLELGILAVQQHSSVGLLSYLHASLVPFPHSFYYAFSCRQQYRIRLLFISITFPCCD